LDRLYQPKNIADNYLLIIGGDGLIGQSLKTFCNKNSYPYIASSRRKTKESNTIFLDLKRPETWSIPDNIKCAVICGAITDMADCNQNKGDTYLVNVANTVKLIEKLTKQGIFVSFLSSNQVFDGEFALCQQSHPLNPKSEYGKQKSETENLISGFSPLISIIRLTKVVHARLNIFNSWVKKLKKNESITAFNDYFCAPLDIKLCTEAIYRITTQKFSGTWHVSPKNQISYSEIATLIAKILSVETSLVNSCSAKDHSKLEHIPKNTTLDASPTRKLLNLEFPIAEKVISKIAAKMEVT
jgi:dTDP-4-dehydrorhamnose reductase